MLDACAYEWSPGQVLRVSVAGTDWPNTIAPPAPVTLTVHAAEIELPVLDGSWPAPTFGPGAEHTSESAEGIAWEIHDDVLARTTTARTVSVSEYETPYDGRALEDYRGEVSVDRRTFAQRAHADTTYELSWPGVDIRVRSVMDVDIVGGRVDAASAPWRSATVRSSANGRGSGHPGDAVLRARGRPDRGQVGRERIDVEARARRPGPCPTVRSVNPSPPLARKSFVVTR